MITIEWTGVAKDDYASILQEIYNKSIDAALELDEKIQLLLTNLQKFKHFCPQSNKYPRFRRCVITSTLSLIYETGKSTITIIAIIDSRSNSPFL